MVVAQRSLFPSRSSNPPPNGIAGSRAEQEHALRVFGFNVPVLLLTSECTVTGSNLQDTATETLFASLPCGTTPATAKDPHFQMMWQAIGRTRRGGRRVAPFRWFLSKGLEENIFRDLVLPRLQQTYAIPTDADTAAQANVDTRTPSGSHAPTPTPAT
jgi:hypothetical protein